MIKAAKALQVDGEVAAVASFKTPVLALSQMQDADTETVLKDWFCSPSQVDRWKGRAVKLLDRDVWELAANQLTRQESEWCATIADSAIEVAGRKLGVSVPIKVALRKVVLIANGATIETPVE